MDLGWGTILSLVLYALFFPVYAQYKSAAAGYPGVENLLSKTVGEYNVDVIRGRNTKSLVQWLDDNRTSLPEKAPPIVEDYVAKGWCFLAAKLRVDPSATLKPHPIVVTFPTEQPVYPMRLTGLIPGPLVLDLFVIADGTAEVDGLLMWASNPEPNSFLTTDEIAKEQDLYLDYSQLAWPKATLTRFRTRLMPEQMKEDYEIRLVPAREYRRILWPREAALNGSAVRAICGALLGSLVALALGLSLNLKTRAWYRLAFWLMTSAALVGYLSLILTAEILV